MLISTQLPTAKLYSIAGTMQIHTSVIKYPRILTVSSFHDADSQTVDRRMIGEDELERICHEVVM
jgi:hypothetical protein